MSKTKKMWETNFKTAYERGVARGKKEVGEPNADLLCDGLGNLFVEMLGDLIVCDDADGIVDLEMNFLEGYFDAIESEEVAVRQVDLPEVNDYKKWSVSSSAPTQHGESNYVTDDSRATHPAWTYRETELNRFEPTLLNPLDQLEKPFHYDLNTRILERDYFKPTPVPLAISGKNTTSGYVPYQ